MSNNYMISGNCLYLTIIIWLHTVVSFKLQIIQIAQSVGAVELADCLSEEV